jgi:hypothetical protein
MAVPVLSSLIFTGNAGIDGLPAAATLQQPVILQQLNNAINGLDWKDNCRAASTGNVNLAAPGVSLDAVTLANGDRILLKNQTAAPENGIYIWTASGVALTRSPDAATFNDLESAVTIIDEGTANAGTRWRMTSVNGVIGTNAINWVSDQTAVPAASEATPGVAQIATQPITDAGTNDLQFVTPLKLKTSPLSHKAISQTIGDGTAATFSITHSFNTDKLAVTVREATGAKRVVLVETDISDLNTARVLFASAPAANSYFVSIERLN